MASRPKGYGMTAELQRKTAAKYDPQLAREASDWIEEIVPGCGIRGTSDEIDLHEKLKDGVILCKLAIAITDKQIKFNTSKMAFKMMENIGKFLEAADEYGVSKTDMFQTVDLYEKQNMSQVVNGIHAFGRKAGSRGKPGIGPKESSENKRTFTEEQLKAGEGVIGLQMGSNKGASQAGQNFGKTRAIMD